MPFYLYLLALQLFALAGLPIGDGTATLPEGTLNARRDVRPVAAPAPGAAPTIDLLPRGDTVDFGDVIVGLGTSRTIQLTKTGTGTAIIHRDPPLGSFADWFGVPTSDVIYSDSIRTSVPITLSFTPDGAGFAISSYRLYSDSGGFDRTLVLKGRGLAPSQFTSTVKRDTFDFPTIDLTNGVSCSSWLDTVKNGSGIPFSLTMSVSGHPFTLITPVAQVALGDSERRGYQVDFCPSPDTGTFIGYAVMATEYGIDTVYLRGWSIRRQAPSLDSLLIAPPELDFGDVPVGSCDTLSVGVANISSDTIRLKRIGGLPADLHDVADTLPAADSTIVLVPGDSISIRYIFCPGQMEQIDLVDSLEDVGTGRRAGIRIRGRGVDGLLDIASSVVFSVNPPGNPCQTVPILARNLGNADILVYWANVPSPFFFDTSRRPHDTLRLPPGGVDTFFVRFCSDVVDTVQLASQLAYRMTQKRGIARFPTVTLIGHAWQPAAQLPLRISRRTIIFPQTDSAGCRRDTFTLTNPNNFTVSLLSARIVQLGGSLPPGFTILSPSRTPLAIPGGNSITVLIEYCLQVGRADTAIWLGSDSVDTNLSVMLIAPPREGVIGTGMRFWLDSNFFAKVGTPFALTFNADTIGGRRLTGSWDSVRLRFDPRSLFPTGAQPIGVAGHDVRMRFVDDSTVVVGRRGVDSNVNAIASGPIFKIDFVGLSTGVARNIITIDTAYVSGVERTLVAGNGFVILSGCDMNSSGIITKRAAIVGVAGDGGSGWATLLYTAPEGGAPQLELIDLEGRRIRSQALPPGTGSMQTAGLDLAGVPPGFYLLQLRIGIDRSTTQIMITR